MNENQKALIGRIVHFVSPQDCGDPKSLTLHPAIITQVNPGCAESDIVESVELATFGLNGLYFQNLIPFSAEPKPGHWFWPSRV